MPEPIYLDNNATTPVAAPVAEAVAHALRDEWGNPSSIHAPGRRARALLDRSRARVAALVGAEPDEAVFTSGGSEADNLALRGAFAAAPAARREVVVTAVEHPAVRNCALDLAREGAVVREVPVDKLGRIDREAFRAAVTERTAVVSAMWANNETGAIFPVEELAAVAREKGALFHTDAVQAAGKVPLDAAWRSRAVDLLAVSGHKFHAPKGVGALFVRRGVELRPLIAGGHHEGGRRGGTENVPYAAGLAAAVELALASLADGASVRQAELRRRLERGILDRCPSSVPVGDPDARLPNTACIAFPGVDRDALVIALDHAGIYVSPGAACASGDVRPSHVLVAMGLREDVARTAVRFSLSRDTTEAEVDRAVEEVARLTARFRVAGRRHGAHRQARPHGG